MIKERLTENEREKEIDTKEVIMMEEVLVNMAFLDQLVIIGGGLSKACKSQLRLLLKDNMEIFAWEPIDMTGVKAGIVRLVRYPTWMSNPVLVKKCDGTWRMYINFKNLNLACPKYYYNIPNKIIRWSLSWGSSTNASWRHKGYHQIQMAKEDDEKMAFYTDQGTYCYTKMPYGLKNAEATYQRLVYSAFQSQIGRNLKAYVDDMGIRTNPKKTRASTSLQSPRTLKEMQSLSGKLAALNLFLAKLTERSLAFVNMLKNITKENKDEYIWTTEEEEALEQMKKLIDDIK
ncbi:hypothetical protein Tco_0230943 [Tanacetum coccineum]